MEKKNKHVNLGSGLHLRNKNAKAVMGYLLSQFIIQDYAKKGYIEASFGTISKTTGVAPSAVRYAVKTLTGTILGTFHFIDVVRPKDGKSGSVNRYKLTADVLDLVSYNLGKKRRKMQREKAKLGTLRKEDAELYAEVYKFEAEINRMRLERYEDMFRGLCYHGVIDHDGSVRMDKYGFLMRYMKEHAGEMAEELMQKYKELSGKYEDLFGQYKDLSGQYKKAVEFVEELIKWVQEGLGLQADNRISELENTGGVDIRREPDTEF